MSREKGTFNFAATFEVLKKGPMDAKMLVGTYTDLTNPTTWEDGDGLVWLYDGAPVSVSSDPDSSKNGLYFLKDADNYTLEASWEKLSSSGSTSSTFENIGSGIGIYSGISGNSVYLRSIIGSGNTNVSLSGDSIVIYSSGSTSLNSNILEFTGNTFQPYADYNSGTTFYFGTYCPDNLTRLNLNALLTVTALKLSTGCTSLTGHTFQPSELYWDVEESTVTLQQTTTVKQQIGQELFIRAKNIGAGTIPNGTVVYISGADGDRPTISPARASYLDSSIIDEVVGMTTEDIASGEVGFVTTAGLVRDLNTTGYTAGDSVYLSTTNWGGVTNVKPTYPDFVIEVGVVTKVGETDGRVLIKIVNLSQTGNIRGVETVNPPFTASTRSDIINSIGAGTIYLPASPLTGQEITVIDNDGDAETWNIIIDGNGKLINGQTQGIINTNYGSVTMVYNGTNWYATTITP